MILKLIAPGVYAHWCPGCRDMHKFNISSSDHPQQLKWHFNGSFVRPSFTPAMDLTSPAGKRCRYNVQEGYLYYAVDSHHKFAGHSAPMPSIPVDA